MSGQMRIEPNTLVADSPGRVVGAYSKVNAECQWPYDYYRQLREIGPLIEDYSGRRFWIATSHELVDEVLKSPLFIKNPPEHLLERLPEGGIFGTGFEQKQRNMLNLDPPEHTRIRKLLTKAFTGVRLKGMEGAVQRVVDDLLAPIIPRGEMEFVQDYAYPIPSSAISSILGIPRQDEAKLNLYSNAIVAMRKSICRAAWPSAAEGSAISKATACLSIVLTRMIAFLRNLNAAYRSAMLSVVPTVGTLSVSAIWWRRLAMRLVVAFRDRARDLKGVMVQIVGSLYVMSSGQVLVSGVLR